MPKRWTKDELVDLVTAFRPACLLIAAVELEVYEELSHGPRTAGQVAEACNCSVRGMRILLDALAALELLDKSGERYEAHPDAAACLTPGGAESVVGRIRHWGNCLTRWAQLGKVVQSGRRAERPASVRGKGEDLASFIEAMHENAAPVADAMVAEVDPGGWSHLLDVGGASGTWTIAFLRRHERARATLFDRPEVIPQAEERLAEAGLLGRVRLVGGDFDADAELPGGADLAWISAIVHMNSRGENRALFAKVFAALEAGGTLLLRDVLLDESRAGPVEGALFAVNMLVNTPGGDSYTFSELSEDLQAAGFADTRILRRHPFMNSVLSARKPE